MSHVVWWDLFKSNDGDNCYHPHSRFIKVHLQYDLPAWIMWHEIEYLQQCLSNLYPSFPAWGGVWRRGAKDYFKGPSELLKSPFPRGKQQKISPYQSHHVWFSQGKASWHSERSVICDSTWNLRPRWSGSIRDQLTNRVSGLLFTIYTRDWHCF